MSQTPPLPAKLSYIQILQSLLIDSSLVNWRRARSLKMMKEKIHIYICLHYFQSKLFALSLCLYIIQSIHYMICMQQNRIRDIERPSMEAISFGRYFQADYAHMMYNVHLDIVVLVYYKFQISETRRQVLNYKWQTYVLQNWYEIYQSSYQKVYYLEYLLTLLQIQTAKSSAGRAAVLPQ